MPLFIRFLAATAAVAIAVPASASPDGGVRFDFAIAAQNLGDALLEITRVSGREIVFSADLVAGKRSTRLAGNLTTEEAVARLLRNSGLEFRIEANALIVVARAGQAGQSGTPDLIVTGTRIRGAQAYAPVTTVSREGLRAQGQTDLGEALRTLPQNFGGGQNPYVGIGAENYGSDNLNSGSSLNLRGLGQDATLTLLNGRRLAYDGVGEGVDVSAIPLAAIDRVEIVADGASAIYGSDAVAGVANVVLRRDYSGLETSIRAGAATDGGNVQQQVDAVAGRRWTGGGLVGIVSYAHNSDITADQRSFSSNVDRTTTILPRIDQFSAVLSGHQAIGAGVEAELDILYSRRTSYVTYPNAPGSSYLESGVDRHLDAASLAASPSVRIDLGGAWTATVNANYARDHLIGSGRYFRNGETTIESRTTYTNESAGGEAAVEGVLANLPGGDVRLAAGGGYRWVGLASVRASNRNATTTFSVGRDSYYGFGELSIPVVGPGNATPGVKRLSANLAGRFEHYPQIGDVFTPKLGALYAPTTFLELRATWGRSFKAPTLYQQFAAQGTILYPAELFGGMGYPADATTLYAYGGNPALRPQRAISWSAGAVIIPFDDRRLSIEATYFHTRYTDRIVAPFISVVTALSDPLVAELVRYLPTQAQIDAFLASAEVGLVNYADGPYDPARVVAIVDNRNRNVAAQTIEGVDVSATWRLLLAPERSILLSAAGTYLASRRQLSAGQPEVALAGTVFNPPHFRGRIGASLTEGPLTAGMHATIVGGVSDRRYVPVTQIDGQTSVDLSLGYTVRAASGPLHGVRFQLTALNLFNDLPARIRTADPTFTPFDPANYNPVGRMISVTVAKKW